MVQVQEITESLKIYQVIINNMLSKNAVGLTLLLVSFAGLDVSESDVVGFLSALGTIVSFVLMLWNQLDREDIKWFFFKK